MWCLTVRKYLLHMHSDLSDCCHLYRKPVRALWLLYLRFGKVLFKLCHSEQCHFLLRERCCKAVLMFPQLRLSFLQLCQCQLDF